MYAPLTVGYKWFVCVDILTYSRTVLARHTAPDDGRIGPKHVVRKKVD
jgi:hypothetical protein